MASLAPTLLAAKPKGGAAAAAAWPNPSDGPSIALVTRQSFWNMDGPRMKGAGMEGASGAWQWTVTAPRRLEREVLLDPNAVFEIRLSLKLPPGEYEFLAGYGGGVHEGRCVASNPVGFDVTEDGTARPAKPAGR